ncbi:MAG: right-handed parallel beta-helix repeat-containing protein [Candidatus Saccharimonadales bacterium]
MQFGAAGTGLVDDYYPIQALLTAAATAGFRAFLPAGTYAIPTETLVLLSNTIFEGVRSASILKRTTDTPVPVIQGTNLVGAQVRDIMITTTAGASSTSSNTIGTGSMTFTVAAGLSFNVNDNLIIIPTGSPQNYMVGTITSYSGTSLVINVTLAYGSGTYAAWVLGEYTDSNCAVSLTGCTQSCIERVRVAGNFYVGIQSLNGTGDQIIDCEAYSVINRAFYLYATSGTSQDCEIRGCRINGASFTQYGINLNGSTSGVIKNAVITNNKIDNVGFQGIAPGGAIYGCTVSSNVISGVLSSSGVGIEVDQANGYQPQNVTVVGNVVQNAGSVGIYMSNALYCAVIGNTVSGGVNGIQVSRTTNNTCLYIQVVSNVVNNYSNCGILFKSDSTAQCGQSSCTGNSTTGSGTQTGISSNSNTDSITFVGNVAKGNLTAYATSGTNHQSAANI